jgi:lipoyl(octanoyl) transferase
VSYHVRFEDLGLRDYKEVWDYQEELLESMIETKLRLRSGGVITENDAIPRLIFVEHPHVYTLGKSGSDNNLLINYIQLQAKNATFYHIDRGGDITYHGPGQIVGYPIIDLEVPGIGLREYIHRLEEAVIHTLYEYGITGERLEGATGVWLDTGKAGRTRKICAIGVRVSRSITMHGFAFNVNSDLEYFRHINPCGYTDKGVTSLAVELGREIDIREVKDVLRGKLAVLFDLKFI